MGKWGKYSKHYNKKWESEAIFKGWLEASSEKDIQDGKPEAFCKYCKVNIKAHHSDLVAHTKRAKHIEKAKSLDRSKQPSVHDYGCVSIKDGSKVLDLKLAVFVAMHCAIKSIDHLGELLKVLGKGSPLENTKLHRTKCSKLITNVIAPAQLEELLGDIGDSPYALIVDDSTDISVTKFMALCVRYYSRNKRQMVTDFLGIVQVISCTGEALALSLKEHLQKLGLPVNQLQSIGTDGAPNILDKCAEYAYKKVPSHLNYLLTEAYNHYLSPKRWGEYTILYKARYEGRGPKKLLSLSTTRWLIWLRVSSLIIEQWDDLYQYFLQVQAKGEDFKINQLVSFFKDTANLLYFTFMKTILTEAQKVNLAFEHTNADVTKLYGDLRHLVFSIAGRVLTERAIAQTTRPGVLRAEEVDRLRNALSSQENWLARDQVKFGETFKKLSEKLQLSENSINRVRADCGNDLITLCRQLLERLPPNLGLLKKIQNLSPKLVLATIGRPSFHQLPLDLDPSADIEALESEWQALGVLPLHEICSHPEINGNLDAMTIEHFWSCVLHCTSASGERPFEKLALFALRALTIPVSKAVVERVFSFMSILKNKHRNRMQMLMLESLLRLRVHLKVVDVCCKNFQVTRGMLNRFTSEMYEDLHEIVNVVLTPTPTSTVQQEENREDPDEPAEIPVIHISNAQELPDEDYHDLLDMFENASGSGSECAIASLQS